MTGSEEAEAAPARGQFKEVLDAIGFMDAWCIQHEAPELGALCAFASVAELSTVLLAVKFQLTHIRDEWDAEFLKGDEFVTEQFLELLERALAEVTVMVTWAKRFNVGGPSRRVPEQIQSIVEQLTQAREALLDPEVEDFYRQEKALGYVQRILAGFEDAKTESLRWLDSLKSDMESRLADLKRQKHCVQNERCGKV